MAGAHNASVLFGVAMGLGECSALVVAALGPTFRMRSCFAALARLQSALMGADCFGGEGRSSLYAAAFAGVWGSGSSLGATGGLAAPGSGSASADGDAAGVLGRFAHELGTALLARTGLGCITLALGGGDKLAPSGSSPCLTPTWGELLLGAGFVAILVGTQAGGFRSGGPVVAVSGSERFLVPWIAPAVVTSCLHGVRPPDFTAVCKMPVRVGGGAQAFLFASRQGSKCSRFTEGFARCGVARMSRDGMELGDANALSVTDLN